MHESTIVMPARLPDRLMTSVGICRAHGSAKVAAAEEDATQLLNQCTTEWSRYFIASRIAPSSKYTAALAADLSPQQESPPAQWRPGQCRLAASEPALAAPRFGLLDDMPPSPLLSPTGRGGSAGESEESTGCSPSPLRKVASCAVTARERSRKRVQFADEVGLALTRVKLLTELVQLPRPCDTEDLAACSAQQQQQQQQQDCGLQLLCKFVQPCSRYVVFRETVERNLVSLSLVHLDFATIRGAVSVKNVSYHKRVFARVTFDAWRSHRDVEAAFNGSDGQQDNFAFSVQCPSGQTADILFCVCFECDSGTFWDNNGGDDYRIAVCADPQDGSGSGLGGYTRDFKPDFCRVGDFTEFTAWEHFGDRVYY